MSIKLVLLKSGENIITDVKELVSDEKVCGYLSNKPYLVSTRKERILIENDDTDSVKNSSEIQISLSPWIILSKDTQIPINMEYVVTIVEPVESLKEMYERIVNEQNS